MSLRKSLRRAVLPLLERAGVETDIERKTLQAIRRSVNNNGTALYNLLHCMPLLEFLTGSVGQSVAGKHVLEIGTTDPPGLPLALLLGGCEKFYGNNILEFNNQLPSEYADVVNITMSRLRGVDPQRLQQITDRETRNGKRIISLRKDVFEAFPRCPAEQLPLPDACIDTVFSMSVMEHLEDTRAVLNNLHRILRPGGWSFHLIDLRDHSDFSKPLQFLTYDDAEQKRIIGAKQNRLRAGDFLELFEKTGYRIEWARYMSQPPGIIGTGSTDLFDMASIPIGDIWPHHSIDAVESWIDDDLFASFHPDFQAKTRQELSVIGMCIACQKPD